MEAAATWEAIDSLTPWDRNPRRNDNAVEQVAHSITRFGFGSPILARSSDRVIIGGHTRYKAAQRLGLDKVPVRFLDLDPAEAAALALADNKLGELAEWDDAAVAQILGELEAQGAPIDGLGWDDEELRELLGDGLEAAPPSDDAPEVDETGEPDSQPGAVYQLGPHRLVCGDATNPAVWARLLGGERLQMVWTDPPYGVAVNNVTSIEEARRLHRRTDGKLVANDDMTPDQLRSLLQAALGHAYEASEPGAAWYTAAPPGPLFYEFAATLIGMATLWRQTLIWVKDQFAFGRSDYHYRHEAIFYGWKEGAAHYFVDDRTFDTALEFQRPNRSPEHPTMKPVDLVRFCIRNSSKPGWLVGEPFGGSGTTLMACAAEGRVARLIELDPRYCDVIRRRWTRWADENGVDAGPGALREVLNDEGR